AALVISTGGRLRSQWRDLLGTALNTRFLHFGRNDSGLHSLRPAKNKLHLSSRPEGAREGNGEISLALPCTRDFSAMVETTAGSTRFAPPKTSCTCHLDWRALATAMERSPWHCPEHEISPLWSKRQRAPFASPSQKQAALVISTAASWRPQSRELLATALTIR